MPEATPGGRHGEPDRWPRRAYSLAWLLALPVVAGYLLLRSLRQPDYRRHWAERFLGRGARPAGEATPGAAGPRSAAGAADLSSAAGRPVFWVHAVSVGETRVAQPLIAALAARHPAARFVLTHMTPTGREAGAELARRLPGRLVQRYLPYDLPWTARRFLHEIEADAGVLMETEVWPNLLAEAARRQLPVLLASARLSARSLAKARRGGRLVRAAAARLAAVAAQTDGDRARIAEIYPGPLCVTGNLKFDHLPAPAAIADGRRLRRRFGARPLWLLASTRDGEEALLLAALAALPPGQPAPALLFVPRHPQRFEEVARLLAGTGLPLQRRREFGDADGDRGAGGDAGADIKADADIGAHARADAGADIKADADIAAHARADAGAVAGEGLDAARPLLLLGDSMGEMPLYYGMADVALIGGSLMPLGGQNLIEACACGCPVVFGPHMFNFAPAAADALAAGAARQVPDAAAALRALRDIAGDTGRREAMAAAALAFAEAHRGATTRLVAVLEQLLPGTSRPSPRTPGEGFGGGG